MRVAHTNTPSDPATLVVREMMHNILL
jgi:hypothetical protein